MFKNIITNWRTSLLGLAAGLPMILQGIAENNRVKCLEGLGVAIAFFLTKDANK